MNFNKIKILKVNMIIFSISFFAIVLLTSSKFKYLSLADFFVNIGSTFVFGLFIALTVYYYFYFENKRYLKIVNIVRFKSVNNILKKQIVFIIKASFFIAVISVLVIFGIGVFFTEYVINWDSYMSACYNEKEYIISNIGIFSVLITSFLVIFLRLLIIGLVALVSMWCINNILSGFIFLIIIALIESKGKNMLFYNIISNSYDMFKYPQLGIVAGVYSIIIIGILLFVLKKGMNHREIYE